MNKRPDPTPALNNEDTVLTRLRLESQDIFRGNSAIEIVHAGQCYVLRVTRENKLILTK